MNPHQHRAERQLLDALVAEAKGAAAATLRAAGYRQHARGTWRLSRKRDQPMTTEPSSLSPGGMPTTRGEILAQLHHRIDSARHSPKSAREFLALFLKLGIYTEEESIAQFRGDPIPIIEGWYVARLCAKDDHLEREATRRRVDRLRLDLQAGGDSAVERVIIDRAVACWLAVQDAERNLARLIRQGDPPRIPDQKRLDHSQRRLLDCLKALDQVRRKAPASHRLAIAVAGDLHLALPGGDTPTEAPVAIAVDGGTTSRTLEPDDSLPN